MQRGFYDLILTQALEKRCAGLEEDCKYILQEPFSKEELWHAFPTHVAAEVLAFLKQHEEKLQERTLYATLRDLLNSPSFAEHLSQSIIPTTGQRLQGVVSKNQEANTPFMKGEHIYLPDTPLAVSALLTGAARTPKLGEQLKKELATCDRAEWMVSFIRMTGLGPLMPALKAFTEQHRHDPEPCLRIATTTYMGVTEAKAIEWLQSLPNTEVRVSYDTKNTRLHAKTYIFHRKTGFGSAYVGSSNISKVAMDHGLEWNVKISQRELAHLWDATIAAFESHWEDTQTFEPCTHASDIHRLRRALQMERGGSATVNSPITFFDIRPFRYQEEAMEDIVRERQAGKNRHLIVAATGTGKTMIAAFDYRQFCKTHPNASLLFLAHRKEILEQAMGAFRQVIKDGSLGCLVDGTSGPTNHTHWFCTIQTWINRQQHFEADHFQYVVVDEAHHGSADSYRKALQGLNPESLLGLTATPERMDGQDIRPLFGGCYTHELRLGDAIERTLLSPFVYYGLSDYEAVDYTHIKWVAGKYDTDELARLLEHNENRANWVLDQMQTRVDDIRTRKCLGFCVNINHAEFMAHICNQKGVPAMALTSRCSAEERQTAQAKLQRGEICIIFTVDMYNEGVDIPDVDTVLFLRPTESLTVFLQQLGRGLRRSADKECLVVFDFIAPQHKSFNYARRYAALSLRKGIKNIEHQVQNGFTLLPAGCSISLEEQAQKHILQNIRDIIGSMNRARMIKELNLHLRDGQRMNLKEMIDFFGLDSPDELYRYLLPSALQQYRDSNIGLSLYEGQLQAGLRKLLLQTDGDMLKRFAACLRDPHHIDMPALASVYRVLWGKNKPDEELIKLHSFTLNNKGLAKDILELIEWMNLHRLHFGGHTFDATGALRLHASYTREQVLLELGMSSFECPYPSREGVLHVKEKKLYVFFADINKDENDFSPTTMYEDYAISPTLFHWQSQSATSPTSERGKTYINHETMGYTIMLFIRDHKKTTEGISTPYVFIGPATYVRHTGSKPMSIRWRLEHPLPAHIMTWSAKEI